MSLFVLEIQDLIISQESQKRINSLLLHSTCCPTKKKKENWFPWEQHSEHKNGLFGPLDNTMCTVQEEDEEKSPVKRTTEANSNPQVP